MKHLAASMPIRTIPYLPILNLILAFALLSIHAPDAEAKRNHKHGANADRHRRMLSDDSPLKGYSHSGNVHSRKYLGKNYSRRYFRKDYWQGYQGKRVGQGYQVDGYSRRRGNQLRLRKSLPPAKRSPYARKSSTLWKRTPSAKTRTKSLSPGTFGARTEPNLNSGYITPNFGSTPTTTYSNPYDSYGNTFGASPKKSQAPNSSYIPFTSYGSNPYGMSNDDSQKDSSGTSPETPAWPNYSLITPGWSAND